MTDQSARVKKKDLDAEASKSLIHNDILWLPDLGSNQGPTD